MDRLRSQLSSSSDSGLGEESGGESGDPRLARLTALAGGLQSRLPPAKQEQLTRAIATARAELLTEPRLPRPLGRHKTPHVCWLNLASGRPDSC